MNSRNSGHGLLSLHHPIRAFHCLGRWCSRGARLFRKDLCRPLSGACRHARVAGSSHAIAVTCARWTALKCRGAHPPARPAGGWLAEAPRTHGVITPPGSGRHPHDRPRQLRPARSSPATPSSPAGWGGSVPTNAARSSVDSTIGCELTGAPACSARTPPWVPAATHRRRGAGSMSCPRHHASRPRPACGNA